ncbi:hypothetical protein PQJ75_04465 [Rhodoplanes sp. TEM]|uniref:Uncharacterized protein n=1 Tax=Rhodoplanes tepidamans TaxID=200616 RepID=A0ABT5JFM8_RHOTP|nr:MULTISPECIES: hypothetical protein [Rhodoplanes]MDC7788223.1 hypothetical protein [Rhodoplanes tepidamans]MDC7982972.1 hypothetical protein [Rhodoplanes sp. TEM]MDQ0355909.1 hypothetical protein [Rhodoplanes tepidamans]
MTRLPLIIKIARPSHELDDKTWLASYTYGAAETDEKLKTLDGKNSKTPRARAPIGTTIIDRNPTEITVSVVTPSNPDPFRAEVWRLVITLCNKDDGKLLGFGVVTASLTPPQLAAAITSVCFLLVWTFLTAAAWQLNSDKLDRLWQEHHEQSNSSPPASKADELPDQKLRRLTWKLLHSANPLFISQDSLGYGSLSRFQILIFSSAVFVVLLFIFIHSNVVSQMSGTILALLGITVAGGTFARAASDWSGISSRSRRFLLGQKILTIRNGNPRFFDLLETQGEIDVSKVQALLFTFLIVVAIVIKGCGIAGLGEFQLPDQIVWLSAISQGAYVSGKVLPSDTKKRLEQDLDQLRICANNLLNSPKDPSALNAFEQSRTLASFTLSETYLGRFSEENFNKITAERILRREVSL